MNKKTLTAIALIAGMGFMGSASAASFCWTALGNGVNAEITNVGSGVYSVHGNLNGTTPISGTVLVSGGSVRMSFGLVQASGANAVVWDMALSAATLDGTGDFRWYDSTNAASLGTVTNVPCPAVATDGADTKALGQ